MSRDRFRIAVLEDNFPDLVMIRQSLRESGLDSEIDSFADGEEALAFIQAPASPVPDLMILDINVPGVEGPSVLNAVRASPRWSHVAVFIFSASRAPADIARATALGADRYLVKPMDLAGFEQFARDIKEWLEKTHVPLIKEQQM